MTTAAPKMDRRQEMGLETLKVDIPAKLKKIIGEKADEAGVPMNDYVAKVFAELYEEPGLGVIRRKPVGRPRKKISAA